MKVTLFSGQTSTSSAPAVATGSITTVAKASISDGEYFTLIDYTGTSYVFEFDTNGSYTSGRYQVDISSDTSADHVRDRIITAINNVAALAITASSGGSATVALKADVPYTSANKTCTENVSNGTFAISGMSGAIDGVPLWQNVPGCAAGEGFHGDFDEAVVLVDGAVTASATGSMVLRLWGYTFANKHVWYPLGVGANADKGKLNNISGTFTAMGETGTDFIAHSEVIQSIRHFDRICAQRVTMTDITSGNCTLNARSS